MKDWYIVPDDERPEVLDGSTYEIQLADESVMHITINERDGEPFEVFVAQGPPLNMEPNGQRSTQNGADEFEWVTALTTMVTRLLRAGETLETIGTELLEIHGPNTGHHIPGTAEWSPSIVARIGLVFVQHAEKVKQFVALLK